MSDTSEHPQDTAAADSHKYWAFISYSHSDEEWAQWLHKSLETYRVPKALVGRQTTLGAVPRRPFPVFRDRDELPSASDLGANLTRALSQSRNIIVICSPKSAVSKWVNEEIKAFKALGREDRVYCLIVDGEPNARPDSGMLECFPPAVRFCIDGNGELTDIPTEPIAADARKGKDGRANAKLKLLSGILGVGFDELKQREKQRQLHGRIRLVSYIAVATLMMALGYLGAADAGINLPGGSSIRSFFDRHESSLFRPVHTESEVRRAAATHRRTMLDAFRRGRMEDGWIPFNLGSPQKGADPWAHNQALSALFAIPNASNDELRGFLRSLEMTFESGISLETNGIKYGWSSNIIERAGEKSRAGNVEDAKVHPTLWTAAAVSIALGRPGLLEGEERRRFEGYMGMAQEALRLYHPVETGGWNSYAYQKNPALHDTYSSALALLVLLETRRANQPWEGSTERRDTLIRLTANWLADEFTGDSNPPGWKGPSDDVNEIFDGLSLQIYSLLLRAEAETDFTLPPKILCQIATHLAATNERDIRYPTAKGEHIATIADPNTGREYRVNESVGFLWHPWAIDCAWRWLKRAETHGADREEMVRVRRALGHLVVDIGEEAAGKAASEWSFVAAETLYALSSIPPP